MRVEMGGDPWVYGEGNGCSMGTGVATGADPGGTMSPNEFQRKVQAVLPNIL